MKERVNLEKRPWSLYFELCIINSEGPCKPKRKSARENPGRGGKGSSRRDQELELEECPVIM